MNDSEQKTVKTAKMVFARNCDLKSGGMGQVWYMLDADLNIPEGAEAQVYEAKKKGIRPHPGQIYEFKMDEVGSISGGVFHGLYEDEDWRRQMTTLNRGYRDNKRLDTLERKSRKDDPFDELLEKLQTEYNRLVGPAKHVFLARVIAKITRGVRI